MKNIYLDYAATTPTHPEVLEAMLPYFCEKFGNPSSIHSFGQETKAAIAESRSKLADLIGARASEVFFTSSGTEANNYVLHGVAIKRRQEGMHIITTNIEHPAILKPLKFLEESGFKITLVPVDSQGLVDPMDVKKTVTDETILVSVMHANNEIGTIQPIAEISNVIKELNSKRKVPIYLHTDAVQTVGQIPVNVDELGVDLLSLSAHKFYGPKGVGAAYIRQGTKVGPFIRGGGQERGMRASTENVPGIVGLGRAAELAKQEMQSRSEHLKLLHDKLIKGLMEKIPEVELNGHPVKRLSKNVAISVKYVEGEAMLLNLDMQGIAVSTGSACASGALQSSGVLAAIGKKEADLHGAMRFSLGRLNTMEDIDYVLEVFPQIVKTLRKMSPLYKGGK